MFKGCKLCHSSVKHILASLSFLPDEMRQNYEENIIDIDTDGSFDLDSTEFLTTWNYAISRGWWPIIDGMSINEI